ncbi:MAG: efflux RND transporter permease subunit [Desulfobulbaceae bacterium]|nr:efflux RND transporter permease subunit [Desulfobulbaceae bacterium]
MNIPELFIRRPVMTTLIMLGILVFGIMSYGLLPVSELPSVDFPTIQVTAGLPGASPETMASSVATPLERQFSTIAGVDSMTSTSGQGVTNVTLQFSLDRDIDGAALDVQTAISKALKLLPAEMPSPPSYSKVNPADSPIFYVALSSDILPLSTVDEYAETLMAQRISMVSGVAQVQVYGAQKYAVRVQVNPQALSSMGISLDEVSTAIQGSNVNLPTGTLYGRHQAFTVQATGQLGSADAYRPLIVAYRNGSPIRLEQLGRIIDSVENDKAASWFNRSRAIVLAIQRQPGTNTVEVVDAIKELLPSFRERIPASVNLAILYDRSQSIRESVDDVKFSLYLAICLVVMVIFLFLRNFSATVISSLALPLSIIGTFAIMERMGYSLDNISLMAITLSVGFVVDDAIVMLENIVRHMEMGKDRMQAALDGSREIGFTIVSMTLSLTAVFIPLFFMGGIMGRLLHEFAVTITAAVLISGFVSLSLTPMLCSRFLRPPGTAQHGRLYAMSERFFDGMRHGYERSLQMVLRHRLATLIFSILLVAVTAHLFMIIPKEFIPSQDTGRIVGFTEGAQGISYQSMVEHQQAVAEVISQEPDVSNFMSAVGARSSSPTGNSGRFFLTLKPRSERQANVDRIIQDLRQKLAAIPGIKVFLQNPPIIRVGGRLTKGLYQYTLQATDMEELQQWAPLVEEGLRDIPELQDLSSDLEITNPQVMVNIDRNKAMSLGITPEQIESTLYDAYGSRQVSTIYTSSNQYQVILEVEPQYQKSASSLSLLYLRSSSGKLVPMDSVATLSKNLGPLTINHTGQLPSVTLSFNLKPGVALGDAVDRIRTAVQKLRLPATVITNFQGTAQEFEASAKGMWFLLIMAILVIYIVLGILYESFIHPLTILSGLPSAGVGALLTLLLFDTSLSIYAFVGVIMLIGIVKKNAIMMIDFALMVQRREGKSPAAAIYQGCILRFRPIMMTTMAALMGSLPIALGFGAGAEARRPLGLAVVGGLILSQFLTLYITPVIYIYLESFLATMKKLFKGRQQHTNAEETSAA